MAYVLLMGVLSALCFADLASHGTDNHDAETFRDNARITQDFSYFFSLDKEQVTGRPVADLFKWIASLFLGSNPAAFHLLVAFVHTLASLALAFLVRQMGAALKLSFLSGLLFLVNVTHFQAVYHISALDYSLALVWSLLGLYSYLCFCQHLRPLWLGGTYAFLVLGVLTHMAAAAAGPLCLYWSWQQGHSLRAAFARLAPLGAVLAGLVLFALSITPRATSTWAALEYYGQVQVSPWSALRLLAWFAGRLFITAHWVPLSLYREQTWELYLGAAVVALLLVLVCKRVFPLSIWSAWLLLALLPFLFIPEDLIFHFLPEGPSRYLYLATAGSSVLLAWVLWRPGLWLGTWRYYALAGGTAAVLVSSYVHLKKVEGFSHYTSGRHHIAADHIEEGVHRLQQAIAIGRDVIPLQDAYLRLCTTLLYLGRDPRPELSDALLRFPGDLMLGAVRAVLDAQSSDPSTRGRGEQWLSEALRKTTSSGLGEVFKAHLSTLYTNLGKGHLRREEPRLAIRALECALDYAPGRSLPLEALANAWLMLGQQQAHQRQTEQAVASLERAVELAPHSEEARRLLQSLRALIE
jgi:tetratricopeptide (TPR) repeat protein